MYSHSLRATRPYPPSLYDSQQATELRCYGRNTALSIAFTQASKTITAKTLDIKYSVNSRPDHSKDSRHGWNHLWPIRGNIVFRSSD